MNFIELTGIKNNKFMINLNHIESIKEDLIPKYDEELKCIVEVPVSTILYADGSCVRVKETYEQIRNLLRPRKVKEDEQ